MLTDYAMARRLLDKFARNDLQELFVAWVLSVERSMNGMKRTILFEDDYVDFHEYATTKYDVPSKLTEDVYGFEVWMDENIFNHPYRDHPTLQRLKHDFYFTKDELDWIASNRMPSPEEIEAQGEAYALKQLEKMKKYHPLGKRQEDLDTSINKIKEFLRKYGRDEAA